MDRDAIIDFSNKDHFTQLLLENAIIQHWLNKGEFYIHKLYRQFCIVGIQ